ncbi:MAG: cation:proton antiporter [Parvibaculaceae bacterium]|nr:cation:proton antiporter [Parvibaculaceae bacterium]HBM88561.1 potassium transporter TrkA [Rhodobiaceae bacterium]|tara:strand:- start:576 stop:2351 length:1776 start_codon:yes stop_codon:yes gene_type:complete
MPVFEPTSIEILFWEALALIVAACIFAPLFRALKLGAILGYLTAGLAVQVTLSLSFSAHPEDLLHFAEFGVVLFLFVIGLELKPSTLWDMRRDIFGLGLLQMMGCGAVLAVPALLAGFSVPVAVAIGLGLALSSTALVMQLLEERGDRGTTYGRKSFSILLFQDLAIVPLLLLVAILAPASADLGLQESLTRLLFAFLAIAGLIGLGRYLLNPMFRLLAQTGMPEITTAGALGVVIMAALLMDLVGMSYAMGAFIAGVMLAESEYRHEIEADIEPFRGLFLGLFFMAVGLSLDLGAVAANIWIIFGAVPLTMAAKAAVIYSLARGTGSDHATSIKTAFVLPQHGEFGFVLFAAASTAGLFTDALASILIAIVTVSMAASPLFEKLGLLFMREQPQEEMVEDYSSATANILMIGFGRFGQIVAQPLFGKGCNVTILDADVHRVNEAKKFGFAVHFGDGTRRDVLRAAGAEKADIILVCIDNAAAVNQIVDLAKSAFPHAKLFVRSWDRAHSIELRRSEVEFVVRETFESALRMGAVALEALGTTKDEAEDVIADIRRRDRLRLAEQAAGDMRSGMERLHVQAVKPEPLPRED